MLSSAKALETLIDHGAQESVACNESTAGGGIRYRSVAPQLETDGWRHHGLQQPTWGSAVDATFERIFLTVLERRPELAPGLFRGLFKRCPTGSLVRCLAGTGSFLVMRTLPAMPFLKATAGAFRAT